MATAAGFSESGLCTSALLRGWEADKAGTPPSSSSELNHFKEHKRLLSNSPVLYIIRERGKYGCVLCLEQRNLTEWKKNIFFFFISQKHGGFVAVTMCQFSTDISILLDGALAESGLVS